VTSGPGYGGASHGAAARAELLASDADRDRAVELLKQAFTEGRLTKDDYDARAGHALAARSFADLDRVLAGLPSPPAPAVPKTNSLAVASLACGAGQLFLWPLATIPAIVLGHVARRQIRRTGENGAGLALAGLLLGWAGAAVIVLVVLGVSLVLATAVPMVHLGPTVHVRPAG
jgi:Domain of unknown function (DUF1707)/Domain of unknown function (DUF4190)